MEDTLYYSCKLFPDNDRRPCLIAEVDSNTDWDAEKDGQEPGYEAFLSFLGGVVFNLINGKTVEAAFTERGRSNPLTKWAERNGLEYARYPVTLPEMLLDKVYAWIGKRGNTGSGISVSLRKKEQLARIMDSAVRSNEWVFLVEGERPIPWSELEPFYLGSEKETLKSVVLKANLIIYHEANLCYAEVQSCSLPESRLVGALEAAALTTAIRLHRLDT